MSSYVPYKAYKASPVPWLDEIPVHWAVSSLRWLSTRYTGGTPERENPDFWSEGSIPWLNSGAVNDPVIRTPSAYISEAGLAGSSAKWIPKGALVMALAGQGKTKGTVAQLGFSATCNQSMAALIPTGRVDARYLFWWLRSNYANIRSMSGGDLRDGLNLQLLGDIPVPLPSPQEQRTIVDFLDRETARIDELIHKHERLIELLAEKRQAIITQAVTKNLDPTAPTKPSGITGLGEIPAHWTEKPMCHFMTGRVDYRGATPQKTDHGVFLVTAKNVRKGFIDYAASSEYVAQENYDSVMSRGIPAVGDILMTMEAPLGNIALVDDPNIALAQRVVKFRPKNELIPEFAAYAMNSPYFQNQLEARATGSTALGLKASKLIELRLVAPSGAEQQRITDYLDSATGRIDALVGRSQAAVKLLMERRSALISTAVIGKIDVTNEGVAA